MKYPEIFDFTNVNRWKALCMRKESLSKEWDLMIGNPCTDVLEIPFFTEEFCDKFLENIENEEVQVTNKWGTRLKSYEFNEHSFYQDYYDVIEEYGFEMMNHYWSVSGRGFREMNVKSELLTFEKGDDIRLHHDFVNITKLIKFDKNVDNGGELYFEKYDCVIKPKQGHLYIFPGQITHRYGVKMVRDNNVKYMINYCNENKNN
jgi:hypothetical protein